MKVFLPLDDEFLDRMDGSETPVPYVPGMAVWSSVEILSPRQNESVDAKDRVPVRHQAPRPTPLQDRH